MMSISLEGVAGALAHCDPEQHADALARAGAESIARATNALDAATRLVATFPRDEVVAEADALLYDVLRWPLSDGVPRWEQMVTPESFAARQGISVGDAQLTVERLHATEADAARALLATGPIANYTLEQSQGLVGVPAQYSRLPLQRQIGRTGRGVSRDRAHSKISKAWRSEGNACGNDLAA